MALPNVTQTILQNGLGLQPPSTAGLHVKVGACSTGTVNTLYAFTTYAQVRSTIGYGPVPDSVCFSLGELTNGIAPAPVLAMRATASTAATSGSVTPVRTSTSTGTVATTGSTPFDTYPVVITITKTGTLGAGAFTYTLDGGKRVSPEVIIPSGGTYAIPNSGVVAVFTAGAGPIFFELGDTFTWATVEPKCTTTNLGTAADALFADPRTWGFMHIVGVAADEADLEARFDAIASKMNTAETLKRYARCIIEGPSGVTDSALIAGMTPKVNARMAVASDFADGIIPDTGNTFKRSSGMQISARIAGIPIREDAARVKSGSLSSNTTKIYRDESVTPGLDDARFSTLRTWIQRPGIFVGNAKLFSAPGSDFRYFQHGRIMDVACNTTYFGLVNQSSDNFLVDPTPATDPVTGLKYFRILEAAARSIESEILDLLADALVRPGHASQVFFSVSRTDAILTSETLTVTTGILPFGYAKIITNTISFVNPSRLV